MFGRVETWVRGGQVLKWTAGSRVDHALADPKQTRALLAELPAFDHIKSLEEISSCLEALAGVYGVKLDRSFEVADLLDTAAKTHHARLVRDYLATSRQQKFQEVARHAGGPFRSEKQRASQRPDQVLRFRSIPPRGCGRRF